MVLQVWLVPSEDDCQKINNLKNWGTADLQIEDGIIETYPHITVTSFGDKSLEDLLVALTNKRHNRSFAQPMKVNLELELADNVASEDDFWRTAYMSISNITVRVPPPDEIAGEKTEQILNFFGNSFNEKICSGNLGGNQYYKREALPRDVISASERNKYPYLSLVHTISGGKDRSKHEEIAKSLASKVEAAFPGGKLTVDRICIVDCPLVEPAADKFESGADRIKRMPEVEKSIKENHLQFNKIPGFIEAMQYDHKDDK